jgi:membrane dipeptidase
MIPIFDGHLDLAWNALSWNRDLTLPLDELRRREAHLCDHPARGRGTVCLPELRRGGVRACLATLLARAKRDTPPERAHLRINLDFASQPIAAAAARGQHAYYRALEEQGHVRTQHDARALEDHWSSSTNSVGVILAMEGADPIINPSHLDRWFAVGLRVVGLAHYGPSAYAVGTGDSGPLTSAGVQLLRAMRRLGMILDLTHCSDPSFFQALDTFGGPVLASHSNCRALVPGDRQFSDEQIRLIVDRGGVIGAAMDCWMLQPGWQRDSSDRLLVTLATVADHIDHVCQLAGNARHAAIGSDLDGGFGTEQCPADVDSIADVQQLAPILASRGYSTDDLAAIFHGNWLRLFRENLKG